MKLFNIIIFSLFFLLCISGYTSATPYTYVTNYGSDTVSVIDTATNTVTATISVGTNPYWIVVTQDGTKAYVTNHGSDTVSVIDTATNTVTATISVGSTPYGIVVTQDGTKAYVTNAGSGTVSVIDTATNTVTATVNIGNAPYGITVNSDGTKIYVAINGGNVVSVIDTATNTVTATVNVGVGPIQVTTHGTKAYVTNYGSNTVSVIDTATNTVTATISVGTNPYWIVVTQDGTKAYVTNAGSNTVSVIDTATNTVTATVSVGSSPRGGVLNPDGTKLYVINKNDGTISIVPTALYKSTTTISVGTFPINICYTPFTYYSRTPTRFIHLDENIIIKFNINSVGVISVSSPSTTWSKSVSPGPNMLVFPDDFDNANTTLLGNYTLNISDGSNVIVSDTFTIKDKPLATFISTSDIHYDSAIWNGVSPTANIYDFINDVNHERYFHLPNAAFLIGDLYYRVDHAAILKQHMDHLSIPYYTTTGNHEAGDYYQGTEDLGSRGTAYYNAFGEKYNYNVILNNINFVLIGCDMDYPHLVGSGGYTIGSPSTLYWLNSTLNTHKNNIVFYHYPLVQTRTSGDVANIWEGCWTFGGIQQNWHNTTTASLARGVLERNHVPLVLAGHTHTISKNTVNNVTYITDGALQYTPYIYMYCEAYQDRIEVHMIKENSNELNYDWWNDTDDTHGTYSSYTLGNPDEQDFIVPTNFSTINFNSSSTAGIAPFVVKFTDTSKTSCVSKMWDFNNDGVPDSTDSNPSCVYYTPGTYSVNLTVNTGPENISTVKSNYITVSNPSFWSNATAKLNWIASWWGNIFIGEVITS